MNNLLKQYAGMGIRIKEQRIICCNQTRPETKHEPFVVCCEVVMDETFEGGHPYSKNIHSGNGWSHGTLRLCGTLMHPSCIERHGPCHADAETVLQSAT